MDAMEIRAFTTPNYYSPWNNGYELKNVLFDPSFEARSGPLVPLFPAWDLIVFDKIQDPKNLCMDAYSIMGTENLKFRQLLQNAPFSLNGEFIPIKDNER